MLLSFIVLSFLAGFIVPVNIWYYKRRSKMTPEERRKEDEESRLPGDW